MVGPLLETKVQVPRRRRDLVGRPRLIERLRRGETSALTLVSAPAGFGKTTLLTEWLASAPDGDRSVAWLSLDTRDNDPLSFWTYVAAALATQSARVGAGALSLLQSPQAPIEAVLATLLNDLNAVTGELVLVFDDFHVIDDSRIHQGMAFLLEHLPPQVHVVMATRVDPALPLARLRARGDLVEVRAADLRFTRDESTAYLTRVMGLVLTTADVALLDTRTEGWIAALQLAALSMQERSDVTAFIAGFAGDDRYIVDYLAEEVLQRQPRPVRDFLLQTSILGQLTGPLCDAVTEQEDGKATLASLERENLFLVPLDDRREWYRYHQLFADVLHAHLLDEQPDRVPDLHRRASAWYELSGELPEAVRHALAARDLERAADLVEAAMPEMRRDRRESTLRAWLEALPDELLRVRPVLSIGFVGALLATGTVEGVERRLADAERWVGVPVERRAGSPHLSSEMVVVDEQEFSRLPCFVAVYRAGQALLLGDPDATVRHAHRALDLAQDDDHLGHSAATALLGLVSWADGDLEAAHASYAASTASLHRAGHRSDVLGCTITLADIRIAQGRLGEAMQTYEQALHVAAQGGGPAIRGTADMYVGMSAIHRERGDLQTAERLLGRSQKLGDQTGLPRNLYRWRVAMARIRESEGDLDGALVLLDEAERLYVGDFQPDVRPVSASRARVLVALGRVSEAARWASERGLGVEDDLSYLREFEHLTLARVRLAQSTTGPVDDQVDAAIRLLERLAKAAELGERAGSLIEVLVLLARAHQLAGDTPAALTAMHHAVTLAEPEGYVRVFADEGAALTPLLRAMARTDPARDYVRRLLAAVTQVPDPHASARDPEGPLMVEPLSERELDVLRLLGGDMDGPGIARELVVSLNTVRSHTKNIYAKLGVNDRRAAVRRAGELNLLSRSRDRRARST